MCFDKDSKKHSLFKLETFSENHVYLGCSNNAVVSDVAGIHLRQYKIDATGSIILTKHRITLIHSVWLTFVREFVAIDQASHDGKVFVFCPHFSLELFPMLIKTIFEEAGFSMNNEVLAFADFDDLSTEVYKPFGDVLRGTLSGNKCNQTFTNHRILKRHEISIHANSASFQSEIY
ncbi:hypothetical protein NPIL_701981 [Nephila pilipes]|uniref:Uncharacterized protein n=1 Tax=Nephila pilipes TaxID=299642 RepID=A0A8X6UC37_NEPPI|nr:hypothetical protein NPIL_701981 [Nephila pilipes]